MTLAEWRRGRLVGTVEQVRQQLADWEGAGVHTVMAGLGALPFAVTGTDDLELLASAIPGGSAPS
jgi:alkanesulfonate monooxygenase SsuD/methylene tetrahydromethanopterin reductase-like flavin-dependent oxidoreductase (luciferase family)